MKEFFLRALATVLLAGALGACAAPGGGAPKSEQLSVAGAMWQERCKKAGVFIHRRVTDVEGIVLVNVRSKEVNFGDQFAMTDPYGDDLGGDAYIMSFLRGYWTRVIAANPSMFRHQGYRFVEAVDPQDGKRYRYTGEMRDVERVTDSMSGDARGRRFVARTFVLDRSPPSGPSPRYGVSFEDISTVEDRQHWIAGSSLKVIDLETKEIIAERIGYMVDRGQGNRSGGRSPWLLAATYACPGFGGRHATLEKLGQAARFVEDVLNPAKESEMTDHLSTSEYFKLETFNFTRYGTVDAKVRLVTADAVNDEKRGAIFPVTLALADTQIDVDGKMIRLAPGMNVTAEIKTGQRRVIDFLLSPI